MDALALIALFVKKMLDDQLSSNELRELQQFFRPEKVQGDVELWLDGLWKEEDAYKRSFFRSVKDAFDLWQSDILNKSSNVAAKWEKFLCRIIAKPNPNHFIAQKI